MYWAAPGKINKSNMDDSGSETLLFEGQSFAYPSCGPVCELFVPQDRRIGRPREVDQRQNPALVTVTTEFVALPDNHEADKRKNLENKPIFIILHTVLNGQVTRLKHHPVGFSTNLTIFFSQLIA